jgi:hypothetical protein
VNDDDEDEEELLLMMLFATSMRMGVGVLGIMLGHRYPSAQTVCGHLVHFGHG